MLRKRSEEPNNVTAHTLIKEFCVANNLSEENLSMMTLLLPPGNQMRQKELMRMVDGFLRCKGNKYVICIEPVVGCNDLYRKAGFHSYKDDLPWYHAHVIIQDDAIDRAAMRQEWYQLVNRSNKKLFLCTPLEKSLSTAANYVVKFLEKKRDGNVIFKFSDHQAIKEPDNTYQFELSGEQRNPLEPSSPASIINDLVPEMVILIPRVYELFLSLMTQILKKVRKLE